MARQKMPWTKAEMEILVGLIRILRKGGSGKDGRVHGGSYCEREAPEDWVRICFIFGRSDRALLWGGIVPIL